MLIPARLDSWPPWERWPRKCSCMAHNSMCRLPEAAAALAGRLETILELLGQLICTFRPPVNSLLPVLSIAGQTLTLPGLHLLQQKATGASLCTTCWYCMPLAMQLLS